MNGPTVQARARSREDRAGDPLDGLVNLFDLGIVLAVAFLLAALSSVKLTPEVLGKPATPAAQEERRAPAGSVTAGKDDEVRSVKLQPGERVVGKGKAIGTVYLLEDGRTIVVEDGDAKPSTP